MKVSFIIPTKDSGRTIERCLESCRRQAHDHVSIIVVDNNSADATLEVAKRLADTVLTVGPERSAQRNAGAGASDADVIVFVDSDMILGDRIAAEAASLLQADEAVGAAVIPEYSVGRGYLARCRALERRINVGDPAVEAARIFRRSAFEAVGGYSEQLTGPEDYDLPDRIKDAGWKISRIDDSIQHDEGRISLIHLFRKKRYYGRGVGRYLRTRERSLVRWSYWGKAWMLQREPWLVPGLLVLKVVDLVGIATGVVDGRCGKRGFLQDNKARPSSS